MYLSHYLNNSISRNLSCTSICICTKWYMLEATHCNTVCISQVWKQLKSWLVGDYITAGVSIKWSITQLLKRIRGLPWWRSGWESACQCRGHRFEPWSGKIPHAVEQLGPWATVTEPARLEPVLRNKRGRDNERPAHRDEEWPPLAATRESPPTETKTQHSQK